MQRRTGRTPLTSGLVLFLSRAAPTPKSLLFLWVFRQKCETGVCFMLNNREVLQQQFFLPSVFAFSLLLNLFPRQEFVTDRGG